jgi:tetratricopeptide (TPR) repeat protein
MSFRDALRHLTRFACLAALGAGIYWSVRLAWADYLFRLDTESSVGQAVELAPSSAEYHARLATLLDNAGRAEASVEFELRAAVAANPRAASAWIELGMRAENAGRAAQAETYVDRAARADRMYSTQWTLANFHFRHNQRGKFWPAAQRALRVGDVAAYDPAPLFRLCWKLTRDSAVILERAIPDVGPVQARYLEFLVRENLTHAAEPVTERVVAFGGAGELGAVFEYCDRLIAAGDAGGALHAWNALCWRTLRGYRPLAPAAGLSLTNGDFANAPVEHGFDWRMPPAEGVAVERGGLPPRLWVTLDGRQPETCDLVQQVLAVEPARKYRLRFHYQTDGITAPSGLRWRVWDVTGREEIATDAADLASEQEADAAIRFTVPRAVPLARLALAYRRAPGTIRIEGRVALAGVSLEFDR